MVPAHRAQVSEVHPESGDNRPLIDDPLDYVSDPLMLLDGDGNIVAANLSARATIGSAGTVLDGSIPVEPVLSKVRLSNGGGTPPWMPLPGTAGFDAIVSAPEPLNDEPIFELKCLPRAGAEGWKTGWVVRLVEVTPLIAALREQRSAADQRDQLLKLLSHDMRAPLAAILTTLRHPDLGAMPINPRRIIERAAYRALHMVDYNVRLIRAQSSDYSFVALNLSHVVEEVIDSAWSSSKTIGVELVFKPPDDEPIILADRGVLTEALTDLLNQILNTSRPGGTLVCKLSATTLNDHLAVTLSIGEVRDKSAERTPLQTSGDLTSPFEHEIAASNSTNGLVFLKTVVARHSGTTTVQSESGHRQTVLITIPALKSEE